MTTMHSGFVLGGDGRYVATKDPDDSLFYGRDLSTRFPGRSIAGVAIAAQAGVTASEAGYSGLVASVRVAGGTVGVDGSVTLRCTLDNGEITDLTLHFEIANK